MREDDPVDQEVTSLFFVLNLFYVGWASGARRGFGVPIQRPGPAFAFLALFMVLRTAFLTTLETPEPRYVLLFSRIVRARRAGLRPPFRGQ